MDSLAATVRLLSADVQGLRAEVEDLRAQVSRLKTQKALLSARAVATFLDIDRGKIPDLVKAGMLRPVPTRGRYPKFNRVEVEKLAERGLTKRKAGRPVKIVHDEFGCMDAALAAVRSERRAAQRAGAAHSTALPGPPSA